MTTNNLETIKEIFNCLKKQHRSKEEKIDILETCIDLIKDF